ncbi:MAG TPA: nuclear transport factor 2 family protein [Gammaproteobacteria bacterium]|nr:nuclear transport factor 2 family protein [Gammaproteobacteria bacterium]
MNNFILSIAEAYYATLAEKNVSAIEKYLHPDVKLVSPLAEESGKIAVLQAIAQAASLFNTLIIRAKFCYDNQAMLAYDVNFPEPVGNIASAVLMTFQDNLILKIELFYDARKIQNAWKNPNE